MQRLCNWVNERALMSILAEFYVHYIHSQHTDLSKKKDNLTQHLRRVHHQDIPKTWRRRENKTTARSS